MSTMEWIFYGAIGAILGIFIGYYMEDHLSWVSANQQLPLPLSPIAQCIAYLKDVPLAHDERAQLISECLKYKMGSSK
jgi:hypothetical protein